MSIELFANIVYDIKNPNNSYIKTNLKKELVSDFISEFVRSQ
jgi:hypothetical protein